jgi:nucleotide-binding universal stress UspA family protein
MPIVCGTDLSKQSRHAVDAAVALARRISPRELRLVHVLEPAAEALDAGVQSAAEVRLKQEVDRIAGQAGVPVHHDVLHGSASQTLVEFARAMQARLLVVSSQGHGGSPLFRVGRTSERVAQLATTPVLVVRYASPFEAWADQTRPLRVLVGLDFSASSEAALRWIKGLRQAAACDVVVGHVYSALEAAARYGLVPRGDLLAADPEIEHLVLRDLAARAGDLGGSGQVAYRAYAGLGRLGDHLLDLAGRERVDVMVVGTHHKRGLGRLTSVSSVALHYGHASVACIPSVPSESAEAEIPEVRRVLVCTDLSALSNRAVPHGYALLGHREGEVFLLHVLAAKAAGDLEGERSVVAQLLALVPQGARAGVTATRTEIAYSEDVASTICEVGERVGADVICLASHGRSGVARTLVGSVAESVLRHSRRPVLVVRPPAD